MDKLEIIENRKGQKIIFVTDNHLSLNIDHSHISYEQFDAVIYTTINGFLLSAQFRQLSPITQDTFYLKPFFVNPEIKNSPFLKGAADGLCIDHNDAVVVNKIAQIMQTFRALNIEIKKGKLLFTETFIIITLLKFFLLRGGLPRLELTADTHIGYAIDLIEFHIKNKILSWIAVSNVFFSSLQKGYLEIIEDVDVVNSCRRCIHTHLIYTATCPRCASHKIEEHDMLHHYSCANISLESTYMKEGALVCPKCLKKLNHVGVDYDSPMGVYSCGKCNLNFVESKMRVTCVNCATVSGLQELHKLQINQYRYTGLGVEYLTKWDVYGKEEDTSIGVGFVTVSSFKDNIMYKIEKCNTNPDKNVVIFRIKNVLLANAEDIFLFIFETFPNAVSTFKNNIFYITIVYRTATVNFAEDKAILFKSYLKKMGINSVDVDFLIYNGENASSYIISL